MEKTIKIYKNQRPQFPECPYRVTINGEEDPRNRDFEDVADIQDSFLFLRENGLYQGYTIESPNGKKFNLDEELQKRQNIGSDEP